MGGDSNFESLDTLALFVSVVDLGSLSKAGVQHGISQPAVSMRISGLERRMGLHLLDRSTTGCQPSVNGTAVAQWARELLANAQRMQVAVAALRAADGGVTIAASLTIAEHLLPRWLKTLHDEFPDSRVHVLVANSEMVIEMVRSGRATIGFIESPDATPGLRRRVIGHDRLLVAVPVDHSWLRRRSPLAPEHLAAAPMVLRERGSGTRATLELALAKGGLQTAEPLLELASSAAVRHAVAAGVGPTVISELAITDDVIAGRLATVHTRDLDLVRPLVAIWRGGAPTLLDQISAIRGQGTPCSSNISSAAT